MIGVGGNDLPISNSDALRLKHVVRRSSKNTGCTLDEMNDVLNCGYEVN